MSLTGNLEDLPLLDIIQIVSFSKKTGYLTIAADAGEAAIVFRDGAIVCSFAAGTPPADPRVRSLPRAKRDALVRNRIEMALEQLIRLREGQFSFSLTDDIPPTVLGREIVHETLDDGINAQELLLDLARGIDEDRRDSTAALEASFAQPSEAPFGGPGEEPAEKAPAARDATPVAPAPRPKGAAAPDSGPIRALLLVDDEEDVRQLLSDRFSDAGYDVVEAEDPDAAVKKANRLSKAGVRFVLVTDLGMPTSGGASFQGGFEVVKRLWKMNQHPPVLLMTENLNGALQARAKQMGISTIVFKPGLSKLDRQQFEADLRAFAAKILADILPPLSRAPGARPAIPRGREAPGRPSPPGEATAEELSREFAILQRHLVELRGTAQPTQVSMLVMKVAREFFERGILFLVKNEEVRGLGGFGPAPKDESLNLLVREVVIPLSEPSVFLDAASGRRPWAGPLPDSKWGKYLIGKIGRFKSNGLALFPLLAHRETIGMLYGDNAETGRAFGRLDALEVFVDQAGVALENAFLQRKLHALERRQQ